MIPYFLINQLQFAGMLALGYWVLPRLNMPAFALAGSLWPYAALSAAVSLAALGYSLLVSMLARNTEQAVGLGGGIIMAVLGGIMVPVYVMPATMQQIAEFSLMGWGLAGFQKLLLNHYTLAQIQPWLLRLAGFGLPPRRRPPRRRPPLPPPTENTAYCWAGHTKRNSRTKAKAACGGGFPAGRAAKIRPACIGQMKPTPDLPAANRLLNKGVFFDRVLAGHQLALKHRPTLPPQGIFPALRFQPYRS